MSINSLNIYPVPKHYKIDGFRIDCKSIRLSMEAPYLEIARKRKLLDNLISDYSSSDAYKVLFKDLGMFPTEECEIDTEIFNNEAYGISIEGKVITIFGQSHKSCFYGLLALDKLFKCDCIFDKMYIFDYPDMKIRGIIEGFYGTPWTLEDRIEAITTLSKHKMNTYIYGPKDDPYHREKWNEPYPEDALKGIKKLYQKSMECYMDFFYTIGPGLSMKYSDEDSFELLLKKYMQIYGLGVRKFGIFFDDIPSRLLHDEDLAKFEELASAHGFIVNKLYTRLKASDSGIKLIVCGTVYYGRGDEAYTRKLGRMIPGPVDILWTGRSICSQELDSRDSAYFTENTLHKPLYWDNYPVNDANMQDELHIGPLSGRDKDLYEYSEGLVCNVMEYKEASMIPVITACHYLWDSRNYDSKKSLMEGVKEVVGQKDYANFIKFNNYCLKSCISPIGSEEFIEKVIEFKCAANKDKKVFLDTLLNLRDYFKANCQAAEELLNCMDNKKLLREVKPWVSKFRIFNKFCYFMIAYIHCSIEKRTIKGAILGIRGLLAYKRLNRNPVQMMNFESEVLMQSGKS